MTFFERQEAARRNTARLAGLMLLAVLSIVAVVNALIGFALAAGTAQADERLSPGAALQGWFQSDAAIWTSLVILAVIALGSLRSMISLRGGGARVARMVGATPVDHDSQDPGIRRLINVLDEMSIASGTPRPALYVLEQEAGINAFVAGNRPTNAVMVVTRGTLNQLSRDELQGVVGHEYSHILNGDIAINIRLIGLLAGILMIGQLGRFMMHSGRGHSRGSDARVVLAGLAIFLIGMIGTFFGGLIKAAVSRQREFLADAASVQFTRNPDGIAGALWKIGRLSQGSALINNHNEDISHLCFGDSITRRWSSLTATHPPIAKRIAAVHPRFQPPSDWTPRTAPAPMTEDAGAAGIGASVMAAAPAGMAAGIGAASMAVSPAMLRERLGSVTPEHVEAAGALLRTLPSRVVEAVHHPDSARALVLALFLPRPDTQDRAAARAVIDKLEGAAVFEAAAELAGDLDGAGAELRLPLLNLALPVLAADSEASRESLLAGVLAVIRADERFTLSEFALHTVMQRHLSGSDRPTRVRYHHYRELEPQIRLLLSLLARAGTQDAEQLRQTYARAIRGLVRDTGEPLPLGQCHPAAIREALDQINQLTPMRKESVLGACTECVIHDGTVTPLELELLQAIALSFEAPMPPLLVGDLPSATPAPRAGSPAE